MFSSSDLGLLRGKQQAAVERLFLENRDPEHVRKELFVTPKALRQLVTHARRNLAKHQVQLPDRRFAVGVGENPNYQH